MPKENNKKGKRKKSPNDGDDDTPKEKKPKPAKKLKPKKPDEIGKSKQLSAKMKTYSRRVSKNSKYPEPKVSANGKVMPSLAELERMFEGSDDDVDEGTPPAVPPSPERCKTPDQPIVPDTKHLLTPKTIQEISDKVLELMCKLPDSKTPDDAPPLPVVPQEPKQIKSGVPYIVGCKERDKIPDGPFTTVIGRAWDKYGINYDFKREEVIEEETERRKGCGSLSNSIFNPKSEEIAAMLESSEILSDGSVDSNKTVAYEYHSLSPKLRTFSPLPSTSKDNETILMNDMRFNESLLGDSVSNDSSQSDIEVIELPCETILVDDDVTEVDNNHVKHAEPEVEEVRYHPPTFDTFMKDDVYSSIIIDLDQTYDKDDEIIDVDEILAENKNIIDKYKKDSYTNNVTHVQSGTPTKPNIVPPQQQVPNKTTSKQQVPFIMDKVESNPVISSPSTRDKIESIVTDYFKQKSPNNNNELNKVQTKTNVIEETIDLSDSITDPDPPMLRNIMDSFLDYTKRFMESWNKKNLKREIEYQQSLPRNRRLPTVIDTIDLDQSNSSSRNDDSVTFVSTTTNTVDNNQSQNLRNTPNDNSVIIVNKVKLNVTTNKKCSRKTKNPVPAAVVSPQKEAASSTSVGRTIGDCPICMENLSNNAIASTICGHIFCMTCIQAAIKASGKKCPTCRKALKGVGYHQLFL